ncbi:hypothetical protein GCM10027180_33490 [Microbulbifer echini]
MFFKHAVTATTISAVLLAFETHAKTFKYETQKLDSSNTDIQYPGLDLNGASYAT